MVLFQQWQFSVPKPASDIQENGYNRVEDDRMDKTDTDKLPKIRLRLRDEHTVEIDPRRRDIRSAEKHPRDADQVKRYEGSQGEA